MAEMDVADVNDVEEIEEVGVVDDEKLRRSRHLRDRSDPFNIYDDEEFRRRFRFSKAGTVDILQKINIEEARDRRGCQVPPVLQLLIALRYFATGSFFKVVGDSLGVHESTISRCVRQVSKALGSLKATVIRFPRNGNELLNVKAGFSLLSRDNFPGIIGAIDCTHIRIACPTRANAQAFVNRKGYYSINVQVISDHNLNIRNIVARWPGSTHDSRIFRCSNIKEVLESGRVVGHLVGDSGYACRKYLLTPLRNPQTPSEVRYNAAHCRARNVVERTFGVWKRRFPCLSIGLRTKMNTSLSIICATAILHNIALEAGEVFEEPGYIAEVEPQNAVEDDATGNLWRRQIIARHFT